MEQVREICGKYLAINLKPDKIQSLRIPAEDVGPVYTVVADSLIQTANMPNHDVVVHFFADFDQDWEEYEHELEKVAEELEDTPYIYIGKFDAVRNERPKGMYSPLPYRCRTHYSRPLSCDLTCIYPLSCALSRRI